LEYQRGGRTPASRRTIVTYKEQQEREGNRTGKLQKILRIFAFGVSALRKASPQSFRGRLFDPQLDRNAPDCSLALLAQRVGRLTQRGGDLVPALAGTAAV
jgi:hypothetical protein